jgi:hypothetical protein
LRLANNPNVNVAGIITRIDTAQKYIFATGVFCIRNNPMNVTKSCAEKSVAKPRF